MLQGNRIILTDDDIINLADENIHDDLIKKLKALKELILLEREYRENVNSLNNEFFKDKEKK